MPNYELGTFVATSVIALCSIFVCLDTRLGRYLLSRALVLVQRSLGLLESLWRHLGQIAQPSTTDIPIGDTTTNATGDAMMTNTLNVPPDGPTTCTEARSDERQGGIE